MIAIAEKLDIWMPPAESQFVSEAQVDAGIIVEFGVGGSTLSALKHAKNSVYSVESDRDWLAKIARQTLQLPGTFKPVYCDIGPTRELGYPVNRDHICKFPNYATKVWQHLSLEGMSPDLVLIDGRFRVACFIEALKYATPATLILFDDYVNRPHYHVVEEIVKPSKFVGRLAVFSKVDLNFRENDLSKFQRYYVRPQ